MSTLSGVGVNLQHQHLVRVKSIPVQSLTLTIRRARLARVCSSSMVAVGPSGVHPCLGAGMALQHPRPSSLHCRCRMAEDRPHATEPCPRSSGQAHGQQACPELRLTGKRPLCRRFNSTTRGPTPHEVFDVRALRKQLMYNRRSQRHTQSCCSTVGSRVNRCERLRSRVLRVRG